MDQKPDPNIPVFPLEKGLAEAVKAIQKKMNNNSCTIVGVAGGSSSGKTEKISSGINEEFLFESIVLPMDNYYKGKLFMEEMAKKGIELNFDDPKTVELDLLREHIIKLRSGEIINMPIYDMITGERKGNSLMHPKKLIIVEGNFVLDDSLKDCFDFKIFADLGVHGRMLRRLMRDVKRVEWKPADILDYFSKIVQPMHDMHIELTKKNADMIIVNEYCPEVESLNLNPETHFKFRSEKIDEEFLRKIGAERIATMIQHDFYYNPPDRNLSETEEMVRLRDENGFWLFTYKGPRDSDLFQKRSKFEFEIEESTVERFLSIYCYKTKEIKKKRVSYYLFGIIISIDFALKMEKRRLTELGKFVEIRGGDEECLKNGNLQKVLSKLGLDIKDAVKKSYFEM